MFVAIEHGSRRLVRAAVAAYPSAAWTLRQLREVVGSDQARRYLIHDRDSLFARSLGESIRNLGLAVLKSPPPRSVLGGLHHEHLPASASA